MPGAAALRIERPADAADFDKVAGPFLCDHEAENNLPLGLISGLLHSKRPSGVRSYFAVARDGERVVGATMRSGLWLIVAHGTDPAALPLLIEDAIEAQPDTPGVVAGKELAHETVSLWTARTGARARRDVAERIYRLERVIPPRPARGHHRTATPADRPTVVRWIYEFVAEALPEEPRSIERAEQSADRWIESGGLWLWIDGEEIAAMAGAGGRTPHGIRIGAVYTPPPLRRRGYASSLVAALSQAQLDSGLRYCFLYTDLANPTSNKIYQDIGYEPVCDVDQYAFVPA